MNVKKVNLNKNGLPKSLSVKISVDEAIFIAKALGAMNYSDSKAVWPVDKAEDITSEIYGCLTGEFFNKFWDDGVDGAAWGKSK